MPQQFWIKKTSETKGKTDEWIMLNADEFNLFRQSSEARGRYFIEMEDITIEASKQQYKQWRKESNHRDYLSRQQRQYATVPLMSPYLSEQLDGENVTPDLSFDMEEMVMDRLEIEELRKSMESLDADSLHILHSLYIAEPPMTEADLAAEIGVTQQAINKRKKKILGILKNAVVKSEKSQQKKV